MESVPAWESEREVVQRAVDDGALPVLCLPHTIELFGLSSAQRPELAVHTVTIGDWHLLLLELRDWSDKVSSSMSLASAVVADLDRSDTAADEVLGCAEDFGSRLVVWVTEEVGMAEHLQSELVRTEVFLRSAEDAAARLAGLLASAPRWHPLPPLPDAEQEQVAALFETTRGPNLEAAFASRASGRAMRAVRIFRAKCRTLDRLYEQLFEKPLERDLVPGLDEAKLQVLLKHFPSDYLQPLLVALAAGKNKSRNESSLGRATLGVSLMLLAAAAVTEGWVRTSLFTAGFGGILSLAALRTIKSGAQRSSQAADILADTQRLKSILGKLEGTVSVVLCVGVNNSSVTRFGNALAGQYYPYQLLKDAPFTEQCSAELLPLSAEKLIIKVNFRGRNDSRANAALLKLAISLYCKSAKAVLAYGADAGDADEIREDSWLKNVVEMSLMKMMQPQETLVLSKLECRALLESFAAWRAPVTIMRDEQMVAEKIAVQWPHLLSTQGKEIQACFAEALATL